MILIERTIVETYTIPADVFRRKLGLHKWGRLKAVIKEPDSAQLGKETREVQLVRFDGSHSRDVVLENTRHESEYRRNR